MTNPKPTISAKLALALVCLLVLLGLTLAPATAGAQADDPAPVADVEPEPVAPLPLVSVPLRGDVFANGHAIGPIDFAVIWNEDDPSKVQLWAVLDETPTPVCIGDVFESPHGEPVFLGETSLMDPAGTCTMSQLPDRSGITLFAASNDGQWASSIMSYPGGVEPVPIFG